jgi:uncharacterized protein (DUF697 family)
MMMKTVDGILKAAQEPGRRRTRKRFIRSLEETAIRAIITATVTFAVGFILKKMVEKSVAQAAEQGAKSGVQDQLPTTVTSRLQEDRTVPQAANSEGFSSN